MTDPLRGGRRRRPLSQDEINTTSKRIENIVGDPARSKFSDSEFNAWSERQVDRTTDINGNIVSTSIEPFLPEVTRQDLNLDGSVGDNANNARREVFAVKKVLSRVGAFEFMPGLEPTTVANERFTKAIKTFQAGNDLKVDGLIRSGGPTIHALGFKAMGQENGRPSGFDAADFKAATGRDPNRLLSGKPIFTEAVPIAANPNTELRHPTPDPDPVPIVPETPVAKPVVPGVSAPIAGGNKKEPPAKKPTKREFQEALMENGRSTAKAMKIDPNLLKGADLRTYTLIMGIFSYRHLGKRGQRAVNIELEKLKKIDTSLYTQLTTMRADVLIQPAWRIWSLTDSELRESIRRNRKMGNMLSVFSSVPGEAAAAIGPALPSAGVRIAAGGIALPIFIELVAFSMREQAERMKDEVERRKLLR
ncbi:MAG: hypothetical protein ACTSUD_10805 [Alphaproteobacteria bacterium]